MTDIEIIRHELDDIKDRLDKLEAQFSWPTSLSSDWTYVKENPWLDYNDTSLSKRPDNSTWKATYEDLSTWSNNDKN